jgi:bacillithiol biosynthesis cysteine-adding enzyme BshC
MLATFSSAFLRGEPRALEFLPADFRDPISRGTLTRRAAARPVRRELLTVLEAQNQALCDSPARQANLQALAAGAAAVVTGQQVGLFLGPLYTVYKAATAIAAARALARESGVPCVPLFWLQTEDHDFEEIDHCHVPRAGGPPLHLQLPPTAGVSPRCSVAHRPLGDAVAAPVAALEEALGGLPHAADFLAMLRRHYRPAATLGGAFAGLLAEIFADEGLLVLDPRCGELAALAAPLYQRSIVEEEAITAALLQRQAALAAAGYAEQIPTRPSTTLVFFHDGDIAGPRYRLERPAWSIPAPGAEGGKRQLTPEQVLETLGREPLRFSASALLRPLIQDTLLPTAAYVGGPAELSYCAQLMPLYALFGVPQPLAIPRARFRCTEDNTRSWLAKLGLQPADVEAPRAEVLRRLAARSESDRPAPEFLRDRMLSELGVRLSELESLDAALRDPVRRARETIERTIARLTERYAQALLERDHVTTERLDRVQAFLFPDGAPQERYYSLPYFACKYGVRTFKEKVLLQLPDPALFTPGVRDIEL